MATYGRFTFLREAVSCFLAQTALQNAVLIVYNQHPVPILFHHPNVRVINEPGTAMSMRQLRHRMVACVEDGIELVQFWDDDDHYLPWHIETAIDSIGNAVAWKPKSSWWREQPGLYRLAENSFEASWTFKTDYLRSMTFADVDKYEEHPAYTHARANQLLVRADLGSSSSYIYRWRGTDNVSVYGCPPGDIAQIDINEQWRLEQTDTGEGQVFTPSDITKILVEYLQSTHKTATNKEWGVNKNRLLRFLPRLPSERLRADIYLAIGDSVACINAASDTAKIITKFFSAFLVPPQQSEMFIRVTEEISGIYAIRFGESEARENLSIGDVIREISRAISLFQGISTETVTLHAGAVGWQESAILITGAQGSGKRSLTAWFVEKGFSYFGSERVIVEGDHIIACPTPLCLQFPALDYLSKTTEFNAQPTVNSGDKYLVQTKSEWLPIDRQAPLKILIECQFRADSDFAIDILSESEIQAVLARSATSGETDTTDQFKIIDDKFGMRLSYGSFEQIDGVLDILCQFIIQTDFDRDSIALFVRKFAKRQNTTTNLPKVFPVPDATRRELSPFLTIGMATYDDYDGVYFSIQAIRMYHPEILPHVEFLIIDNHPDGACAQPLKNLDAHISNYRYIPNTEVTGTAVRDKVFREAAGEFVLCMDCHVLFVPGSIQRLIDYMRVNRDTPDLLQGPLVYDDLTSLSSHFSPVWRAGMYGVWGSDDRAKEPDGEPFEIPMQGLGVFACRRGAWLGFNPKFRGFGGEEGYIHEKFRQSGGKTLCLPFLRWMHRFARPLGIPYANTWEDRIRNYLIGWNELGLPIDDLISHMTGLIGKDNVANIVTKFHEEFRHGTPEHVAEKKILN